MHTKFKRALFHAMQTHKMRLCE